MFKKFLSIFSKPITTPACLEYLASYGSGLFILWDAERTKQLQTFHEHDSGKIKHWLKLNGYHISDRFETII